MDKPARRGLPVKDRLRSPVSTRRSRSYSQRLTHSIDLLVQMGFAPWTIEYYRQRARRERTFPSEIVRMEAYKAVKRTIRIERTYLRADRAATNNGGAARDRTTPFVRRRTGSLAGFMRRKGFEDSLELLRVCGFEEWAVDYYREAARVSRTLPHSMVRHIVESSAWSQLHHRSGIWRRLNGDH